MFNDVQLFMKLPFCYLKDLDSLRLRHPKRLMSGGGVTRPGRWTSPCGFFTLFDVSKVRASQICSKIYPTKSNVTHIIYFCKLPYMFRVDSLPIMKSTKLYLRHPVFVKPYLLPAAIIEELAFHLLQDSGR